MQSSSSQRSGAIVQDLAKRGAIDRSRLANVRACAGLIHLQREQTGLLEIVKRQYVFKPIRLQDFSAVKVKQLLFEPPVDLRLKTNHPQHLYAKKKKWREKVIEARERK